MTHINVRRRQEFKSVKIWRILMSRDDKYSKGDKMNCPFFVQLSSQAKSNDLFTFSHKHCGEYFHTHMIQETISYHSFRFEGCFQNWIASQNIGRERNGFEMQNVSNKVYSRYDSCQIRSGLHFLCSKNKNSLLTSERGNCAFYINLLHASLPLVIISELAQQTFQKI